MSDALLSSGVGIAMWGGTAGLLAWSAARVKRELDERRVPLMGVMGAFVFAAQMINFAIPGTGSSGHLGGGLLLAALLGPHAAFLTLFSVLAVQALLFGDGGLLALGANAFNLGFFPCFIAYPLIFRPIADGSAGRTRETVAALAAAVVGLLSGAMGVVLETTLSGISVLPTGSFALLMLPIHGAIGVVEGLATAAVLAFLARAGIKRAVCPQPARAVLVGVLALALLAGGLLSLVASSRPDGLEWAIARVTGDVGVTAPDGGLHEGARQLQESTEAMPDYGGAKEAGTTMAGIVGTLVTLLTVGLVAVALRRRRL